MARDNNVDCTVMASLLVHLHGKRTDSFSNQLRQTKSLSPQYAIEWWKERHLRPPEVDPVGFMTRKLQWRYAKGRPTLYDSRAFLGDSETHMRFLDRTLTSMRAKAINLLFTSPPYCGITNYHYDQWLRLWLLGGPEYPSAPIGPNQGKFVDRENYKTLLTNVFSNAADRLARDAVVYIRTDSRKVTFDATVEALMEAFPRKRMRKRRRPLMRPTQTDLFGGDTQRVDEVDIILQ